MAGTFRGNLSRAMTLLTNYTLISGSSKLTQFLLACLQVRYGPFPSYDKVERWITLYRNGSWQSWKGFLESERPLLHGALCGSMAWSLCNSTSFVLQCVCARTPLPNATVPREEGLRGKFPREEGFASWHAIEIRSPECWSSHILSAMEGLTQSYMLNKSCWTVSLIISVGLSWTSGTDV